MKNSKKETQPKLKVDLGDNTIQNIVIVLFIIGTIISAFASS